MAITTTTRKDTAARARAAAPGEWFFRYARSSIGKKQILALSGIVWALFLIAHLAGNLLIWKGPRGEAFNQYSHALVTNPFIYVAEAGLAFFFAVHVGLAVRITIENRRARGPVPYAVFRSRGAPSRRTFASRSMILTGAVTLAFLVLHLITFKFGTHYETKVGGEEMRDLARLVFEKFREPGYVAWYAFAMVALGAHLQHALQSLFETFGLDHPNWTPLVRAGGFAFAWAIALGFLSIPVLVLAGVRP
jgi:succinate dehydrogenase / fumarate reductase cytochrome b subunit